MADALSDDIPASEQPLRPEDHEQDEEQGIDHHAESGELPIEAAESLREHGQRRSPERRPRNGPDPSEDDHHDHFDGLHEAQVLRVQRVGKQLAGKPARHAGKRRTYDEGHHFVPGRVDAHGLGGNFVAANGRERVAEGRRLDVAYDDDGQGGDAEVPEEIGDGDGVREAGGASDGRNIQDEYADDLREPQRHDGQVVAPEPQ